MTPILPETLTTARLTLRKPIEADMEPMIAFYASERSKMALGPLNRTDAFAGFCVEVAHWHQKGYGNYTVLQGNTPIGLVGLWQPTDWDDIELGWLLWDGYEGHGYASEAAQAVLDMAYAAGWAAPVSYIDANNTASKSVATRLGATFSKMHDRWDNTEIWQHRGAAQ